MNNDAKATMKTVGMSVFEEFCAAIKDGNIGFFGLPADGSFSWLPYQVFINLFPMIGS